MEIIMHGKNPDNETMYFICANCGCEFSEKRRYCKHDAICNPMDCSEWADVWEQNCPDCGKKTVGMNHKEYSKKTKAKKITQSQLEFLGY